MPSMGDLHWIIQTLAGEEERGGTGSLSQMVERGYVDLFGKKVRAPSCKKEKSRFSSIERGKKRGASRGREGRLALRRGGKIHKAFEKEARHRCAFKKRGKLHVQGEGSPYSEKKVVSSMRRHNSGKEKGRGESISRGQRERGTVRFLRERGICPTNSSEIRRSFIEAAERK